ncbi:MAG: SlyX family protein [Gammaproteobacteria bacterium]|nr:SlyX family protein [Gammaproteobacteria bacterium]
MTEQPDLQTRFVELETRVAFQEHALQELNDALVRQQTEIDRLTRALKDAQERLRGISAPIADRSEETPPPHY